MIEEYDFNDFEKKINKLYEKQLQDHERQLAEIIENYDFIVGSAELKEQLEHILPYEANIIYSNYVESPTTIFAIKKFDIFSLIKLKE